MDKTIKAELNLSISQIKDLTEQEVFNKAQAENLLKQFKKEDLIEFVLSDTYYDEESQEGTDEEEEIEEDVVDAEVEEKEVKQTKTPKPTIKKEEYEEDLSDFDDL